VRLSSFGHTLTHNLISTSDAHGWRRATVVAVVTWSLAYGLVSLFGALALERGTLPWLAIGFSGCFQNYSICQGKGALGWPCAYGWVKILRYCLW
jgi:hypothetical protein